MRKRYKKFSIEFDKSEKERLAHELGETHKHTTETVVDNRGLRQKIEDYLWFKDHESW